MIRALLGAAIAVALHLPACGGDPAGEPSPGTPCLPSCTFKACGDDGCGGTCGECPAGHDCRVGQCLAGAGADVIGGDATGGDVGGGDASGGPADTDQDGIDDRLDNCPTVYNPDQVDLDGDGRGDACDPDIDGDGADNVIDCAPRNPAVSPFAPELCGDGVDNDCDSATDEEGAADCQDFFVDRDGDGAGDPLTRRCLCAPEGDHRVLVGGDCDDDAQAISPLLPEICDDIDNNCNLLVDEGCDDDGDGYCDDAMAMVGAPAVCPHGGGDCNDYWAEINPGMPEIPGDQLDNNCDGVYEGEGGGAPIEPNCTGACTGSTVGAMLCAMEICYPNLVLASSLTSPTGSSLTGHWTALSRWGPASNDLAPRAGGSYAILGTGPWNAVDHTFAQGSFASGFDPYSSSGDAIYDAAALRLILKAPPGATGFSLDYIFMSAEYEEFIGSQFNDKFYIVLKAPQTTGNLNQIINFTSCTNPGAYHDFVHEGQPRCFIAVNTAFSEPCSNAQTNIAGTGHQCPYGSSSGWLQTSWPIAPNEQFELIFHIHDTADSYYSSHVILDNFRWEGGTFTPGTVSHH